MKRRLLPFSPLTRKSVADVTRRKGRTTLVVLGILIGVLGLTAINVTAGALGAAFAFSANETARSNIAIDVNGADPSLAPELASVPNVRAVQLWSFYLTRWQIAATPGHVTMGIYGSDDLAHLTINPFQLTGGSYPGSGEIVMESSDGGLQSFTIGDMITIDTPNGPIHLRVSGLARTLGTGSAAFNDFAVGYMSAAGLSQVTGATQPNLIDVLEKDTGKGQATAKALQSVLLAHHVEIDGIRIRGNDFQSGAIDGVLTIMRVLSIIALVLTSFLIINTVTTLVAEQTNIIGTLKAVGATRGKVMRSYLTSVAVYGIIGTALGIAAGIYAGYALTAYLATLVTLDLGPFGVSLGIVVLSVVVGLGVPFAAALLPLWNGTRITVREALSAYGVNTNNGARHGRVARRLLWVPQTTWLGLRGIFRRRGRAVLTLLALTLSATAFLAIQTTAFSLDTLLGQLFTQYNTDAFVSISSPQPYAAIKAQLLAVPNVARVERFEQNIVSTTWGPLFLQAAEPDTQLYRYEVVKGRWFSGDQPQALLLSETAAARTGLTVGNTIAISNATDTQPWTVVGIVHDLNGGLGTIGSAITTVDDLHAFNGQPADVGSGFMLQAQDRSSAAVNTMANQLDTTLSQAGLVPAVSTRDQEIMRNQTQFQVLYVLLYTVAAIVALVGILGLFNTLTTSVLERRREIGILRSMGATGRRVASIFWTEGLALASISWVVAILVGIPAAFGFLALLSAVLTPVPFAFSPLSLVAMLVFTLFIASLASVIPALSAARVRIADTLRYE
jgi:putative ABC transport system permease protein